MSKKKTVWTTTTQYDAKYATEVMDRIPYGYINKVVCGCGMTTVALESDYNTIIAVPTIVLALNKFSQYPNERYSHKMLVVYGDTTSEDIKEYSRMCSLNNKPIKVIAVYDSLHKVGKLLQKCDIVVDESQEVLKLMTNADRRGNITRMLHLLKEHKDRVSFVSATPIPVEYMPEWVQKLPQLKINWTNTTKVSPILMERAFPYKALKEEVIDNMVKYGEATVNGRTFKKAVIFINSINAILRIIRGSRLPKEDVGILCGQSLKNDIKIKGYKRFTGGALPKYLFCTASGFSGIDLDDKDSMNIVVSNVGKSFTMLDYMTDVKQAVSRNRNEENPNKNTYLYFYNKNVLEVPEHELLGGIERIRTKLLGALEYVNTCIREGKEHLTDVDLKAYTHLEKGEVVINEPVFEADKYYILEVRKQYLKGFDVQSYTDGINCIKAGVEKIKRASFTEVVNYFRVHNKNGVVDDWGYCSAMTDYIDIVTRYYQITNSTNTHYSQSASLVTLYDKIEVDELKLKLIRSFKIDAEYESNGLVKKLQSVYDKVGLQKIAKPTDIYSLYPNTVKRRSNGKSLYKIQK